jgi:hypothetical protein
VGRGQEEVHIPGEGINKDPIKAYMLSKYAKSCRRFMWILNEKYINKVKQLTGEYI